MSVAEEIEKLANLRNQGLITEREYEERKKRLLRSDEPSASAKSRPWYKSWWLRAPLGIIGIAGLAYSLTGGMNRLPECASAEAFNLVQKTVDNSPIGRTQGVSILKLSSLQEPGSSNGTRRRACIAVANLNNGERKTIHFEFVWADSRKQQIEVNVQFM